MDQQPQQTFGSGAKQRKQRLILGAVIGAVLVALIAVGIYLFMNRPAVTEKQAAYVQPTVCSQQTNERANRYINEDSSNLKFSELTTAVKAQKNFDQDPNCLYILLSYNLAKNIPTDNDSYVTKLGALYQKGAKLSGEFSPSVDLATLKLRAQSVKEVNETQEAADAEADKNSSDTERYAEKL